MNFKMLEGYGHDLKWYPSEKEHILSFLTETRRIPHPDSIYWETEDVEKKSRNHWIRIVKLGTAKNESDIPDLNSIPITGQKAFPRDSISGRVIGTMNDNVLHLKTKGIKKMTVMISPDQYNFDQPIVIFVNGQNMYDGFITKNPETLLNWYSKDRDRTMLYANEAHIAVGRSLKLAGD